MNRQITPLLISSAFLCTCIANAQDRSTPILKILDTQVVDLGDRKITYNRVETPELKPEAAKTVPVPAEEVPLMAQEEEELRTWEAKFQYSLFLGVTVYDGAFSEIRWWDDGQENVIWSNVNFLHFAPFGDLETDAAYYWIMLSGSEITSEEVRALNAVAKSPLEMTALPPKELPPLSQAGPKWMAVGKVSEAAERAMEDFHDYYAQHGPEMAAAYKQREEEARAYEEWVKAHPPIPQDTIINFFPIRSTAFKNLRTGTAGK